MVRIPKGLGILALGSQKTQRSTFAQPRPFRQVNAQNPLNGSGNRLCKLTFPPSRASAAGVSYDFSAESRGYGCLYCAYAVPILCLYTFWAESWISQVVRKANISRTCVLKKSMAVLAGFCAGKCIEHLLSGRENPTLSFCANASFLRSERSESSGWGW